MNDSKISELKLKIGNAAEIMIADGIGLEKKNNMYRCPNSSQHTHGDKNPSMGWDTQRFCFHCFRCPEEIDIYDYFTRYKGYNHEEALKALGSDNKSQEDKFSEGVSKLRELTKRGKEFLLNRGWQEETIQALGIMSYVDVKQKLAYVYRDSKGKIDAVKLRSLDPNCQKNFRFTSISGSSFHLYNKQNIDLSDQTLYICEGEGDSGIIWQLGYRNIVSVGCGANSTNKMLQQEKKFLDRFENIVVVSDTDESGDNLDNAMLSAFPTTARIIDKSLFMDCKDISELYKTQGEEAIKALLRSGENRIEGSYNPGDIPYEERIKPKQGKFIPTGMPSIDWALNQLRPGYTTLVTGRSNDGKSTFVAQLIANAIEKDCKVFWVSGEETKEDLHLKLNYLLIGNNRKNYIYVKENLEQIKHPTKEADAAMLQWMKNKLEIFNKGESKLKTTDEFVSFMDKKIKKDRFNLVVCDNMMSLLKSTSAEKLTAQADFMQNLSDMAKNNNCHIVLVLHPNKELKKGDDMEFEMISGTSDIANKSDNIIFVRKAHDENLEKKGVSGFVTVLKNRKFPRFPKVETYFDQETGMLCEIHKESRDPIKYNYTWERFLLR